MPYALRRNSQANLVTALHGEYKARVVTYAHNVASAVERDTPEAGALCRWAGRVRTRLSLSLPSDVSDDDTGDFEFMRGDETIPTPGMWRKVQSALRKVKSPSIEPDNLVVGIGKAFGFDASDQLILMAILDYCRINTFEWLWDCLCSAQGFHGKMCANARIFQILTGLPWA